MVLVYREQTEAGCKVSVLLIVGVGTVVCQLAGRPLPKKIL